MTDNRRSRTRRARLAGLPVVLVAAAAALAVGMGAGPAAGLDTPPPTPSPTTSVATSTAPTTTSLPAPLPLPTTTPTVVGLAGGGYVLARVADKKPAAYLNPDTPVTGVLPFQRLRLDVQLLNAASVAQSVTPTLEYRVAGTGTFRPVPRQAAPGVPFSVTTEWLAHGVGSTPGPTSVRINVADEHFAVAPPLVRVAGHRSSGANPDAPRSVAPGTATEEEFTVQASIDAAYGTAYELRVTDAGVPLEGLANARVTIAAVPALKLSPGQRTGKRPGTRVAASASATRGAAGIELVAAYPLMVTPSITIGPNGPGTIHNPFGSTTTAQCGICHRTHWARSQNLISAASETAQCYACHAGGTGAAADVQAEYAVTTRLNDPTTRSYYSHDTSVPGHSLDSDNEFQATLNRHSQCSDCHNAHAATTAAATPTTTGWTAPGGFTDVSSVAVTNGAAGSAPTYTWTDGHTPATAGHEYEVCLKCHSSFTQLPANDPAKPSRDFTDVAMEFNPANPSEHPVEAQGANQSQKMADSLAGTSPYKIWNFATTDTLRCTSCHAGSATSSTASADSALTVHASANRGILIRPYEDRVLSASGAFYDAAGSALCLTCHMQTPFMNQDLPWAATGTNFRYHGLHVSGISTEGSGGLDIDTPGAGQGNARCAECHFRIHSPASATGNQTLAGTGLVSFAPDVTGSVLMGGRPTYTATSTGGTCTLMCHGKDHQGARYLR